MISMILGKVNDLIVDEISLGIMVSIFPITAKPITKLNYAQFIKIKFIIIFPNLRLSKDSDTSLTWFISFCLHKLLF
jgi:hypothetical protein